MHPPGRRLVAPRPPLPTTAQVDAITASIIRGADLAPGHSVASPAIIEERFTTIVVYTGWEARVDDAGDYELRWLGAGSAPAPQ